MIGETRPNQTGNTFGEKQRKQIEDNGQGSSQQRTSLPGRNKEETKPPNNNKKQKHEQNHKFKKQTKDNHIMRSSAGYARKTVLYAAEYNPNRKTKARIMNAAHSTRKT